MSFKSNDEEVNTDTIAEKTTPGYDSGVGIDDEDKIFRTRGFKGTVKASLNRAPRTLSSSSLRTRKRMEALMRRAREFMRKDKTGPKKNILKETSLPQPKPKPKPKAKTKTKAKAKPTPESTSTIPARLSPPPPPPPTQNPPTITVASNKEKTPPPPPRPILPIDVPEKDTNDIEKQDKDPNNAAQLEITSSNAKKQPEAEKVTMVRLIY